MKYDWDELWPQAQALFDAGKTVKEVAKELEIDFPALRAKVAREAHTAKVRDNKANDTLNITSEPKNRFEELETRIGALEQSFDAIKQLQEEVKRQGACLVAFENRVNTQDEAHLDAIQKSFDFLTQPMVNRLDKLEEAQFALTDDIEALRELIPGNQEVASPVSRAELTSLLADVVLAMIGRTR